MICVDASVEAYGHVVDAIYYISCTRIHSIYVAEYSQSYTNTPRGRVTQHSPHLWRIPSVLHNKIMVIPKRTTAVLACFASEYSMYEYRSVQWTPRRKLKFENHADTCGQDDSLYSTRPETAACRSLACQDKPKGIFQRTFDVSAPTFSTGVAGWPSAVFCSCSGLDLELGLRVGLAAWDWNSKGYTVVYSSTRPPVLSARANGFPKLFCFFWFGGYILVKCKHGARCRLRPPAAAGPTKMSQRMQRALSTK